jgi:UDP-N-acetylmuramate: L-alanyl-gamma-D-glutamyl-meso-diaminopimelate ligase
MNIHFISIGGSVMHQLAIALKKKGELVTGSDDEVFEPSRTNLEREGLLPKVTGWQPDLVNPELDAVILGMHAREDNPELLRAKELGIPVYSFPEYVYEASKTKTRVVVGGSHGKTTTTSMIMHVLNHTRQSFDYLVGAKLEGFDQSVNITDAPVIVCEGDEYPASALEKRPKFHFLFPHIAVLTGIAWDHINVFPTWEIYLEQFKIFLGKIEPGGVLIYNETDPVLASLVAENQRPDNRYLPYGIPAHEVKNGITAVSFDGRSTDLRVFGNHNLLNMHAAFLVCRELGVDTESFLSAIGSFTGASKRLEVLAHNDSTTIFRDFAHAPSKVKATIEAVREQFPGRKLVAALELHTYSSLNEAFMPHYKGALDPADDACVFYSHHAMEIKKMPPLPEQVVKEGFGNDSVQVFTDRNKLEQWLFEKDYHQTSLLLMSSGTYDGLDLTNLSRQVLGE